MSANSATPHARESSERWTLVVVVGIIVVVLGWFLYFTANFPPRWERTLVVADDDADELDQEIEELMAVGEQEFRQFCTSCHAADGSDLITGPALTGSEWVLGEPEVLARIVLHGMQTERDQYQGVMTGWGEYLSDHQLAGVLTYMRLSWGNEASPVTTDAATAIRREAGDRPRPWREEELIALLDTGADEEPEDSDASPTEEDE